MRARPAITAFSALLAMTIAGSAFSQSGSTGGTIGKQGKSISGEEHSTPRQRSGPSSGGDTMSRCARAAGTWSWFVGGDVAIRSDGTFRQAQGSLTGTWSCSGNQVVMVWSHGFTDRLVLSADGNHLRGSNGLISVTGDRK